MASPEILFLLVNYYNEDEVIGFINQLKKQDYSNFTIAVILNGTKNKEKLQIIKTLLPNIYIYEPGSNLGYMGAAQFGLMQYLSSGNEIPKITILCNTDIEITQSSFFENLLKTDGDITGPEIISLKTGRDQNPFAINRISKQKLMFLKLIFAFYPFYIVYRVLSVIANKLPSKSITNKPIGVYSLHGSFLAFSKSFFVTGGTLNYPSLLFGEEIFIAENALRNKQKLIYNPRISIIHKEHSHTKTFKSPQMVKHMRDSLNYILNEFYS